MMALATLTSSCIESSGIVVERSTGPIARGELAGFYAAVSMVSMDGAETTDLMAAGATLNLTLGENAALSGHLFIPGGAADGSDVDADMTGAWTFDPVSQIVRFVQQANTFVRDTDFEASRDGFAIQLLGSAGPEPPPPGSPGTPGAPAIEVVLRTAG
jgi:hypothetical protein